MFIEIEAGLFGQIIVVSFLAATAGTVWYSRRPGVHTTAGALLVVFAWIVPIFGPISLLIFLAALPSEVAKGTSVSTTNDGP